MQYATTLKTAVLLADDDVRLCSLLTEFLGAEGFEVTVAHDGVQAGERLREGSFDIIVLDQFMLLNSSLDLLSGLRGGSYTPVLMVSIRGGQADRLLGYEMGADDYLPKPFAPRELAIRLRSLLRPVVQMSNPAFISIGNLAVCALSRRAYVNGALLELTNAEFKILLRLLQYQGGSVGREELSGFALGRRRMPGVRSIDTHVSNLRRKLRDADASGFRILAERNYGYSLLQA